MEKYEQILRGQISSSIFAIIIILVLAITIYVFNKKHVFDDLGKRGKAFVNIIAVTVIVSASVFFALRINYLYTDIKEQSYVTYVGAFEVSSDQKSYATLLTEDGSLKLDGKVSLPSGKYTGQIIYAKNSKRILDWSVD